MSVPSTVTGNYTTNKNYLYVVIVRNFACAREFQG